MNNINLAICATGELYGGVEQFIYTFAKHLKDNRDVDFIIFLFNKGILCQKLKELNISIEVITPKFKYDLGPILYIKKLLKKNGINIIHVHGYKATILAGIAAKLLGVRVVKTEHGRPEPQKGFGYLKMLFNLFLDRLLSKYLLDAVVFVSKDIENLINRTFRRIKKYVIRNGIAPIEIAEKKDIEIDRMFFNIGIIGRISEVKGHIYLLLALRRLAHLNRVRLYVFGKGPLEKTHEDYCKKNGLSHKVYFMGFKSNIYPYMSKLDLLVMPSLHEGLPYTILEAMYMKIPIIASGVGGLKEVIHNNFEGILVPSKDEVALAHAIETVYKNHKLRHTFTKNAYRKVCSKFSASNMTQKYISTYTEILQANLKKNSADGSPSEACG